MLNKIFICLLLIAFVLPNFSFISASNQGQAEKETVKEEVEESLQEAKKAWTEYVFPFYKNIWQRLREKVFTPIKNWLLPEAEKRTEYIKEEIKEEAPKAGRLLWQRIKDLFK